MKNVFIQTKILIHICQVYQRAVINPMINIETLWKDYCSFEQSINPMIAEKLTQVGVGCELRLKQPLLPQERSRDYMNARRVAKEYEAVTR